MTAPTQIKSRVDVMERFGVHPTITPDHVAPSNSAYRVRGAFNPGAAVVGDEIVLLLRVAEDVPTGEGRVAVPTIHRDGGVTVTHVVEADLNAPNVDMLDDGSVMIDGRKQPTTLSHLRLARSTDGVNFTIDEQPFLLPETDGELHGVEDARITPVGDRFLVTYAAASADGRAVGLLETFDFETFHRLGLVFPAGVGDASIFPDRSGGLFRAIHRPIGSAPASLWYAESPDLLHWGNHHCVLRPRRTQWESAGVGGGAPAIATDDGWLQLYHARGVNGCGSVWAVLLDRYDPTRVIARGSEPLLVAKAPFEVDGFTPGAITVTGAVERDGELFVYYGAGDQVTGLATTTIRAVLATFR